MNMKDREEAMLTCISLIMLKTTMVRKDSYFHRMILSLITKSRTRKSEETLNS